MDEILYELRDHSAGLNCGRWDYIFSFIKKFRTARRFRAARTARRSRWTAHFLNSYVQLLIKTCHRRGIHAMGGMAAQIPIKNDPAANEKALEKVRQDKLREVKAGHDGTWVAHPGLVPIAKEIFDEHMKTPNQIHVKREDVHVTAEGSAGLFRQARSPRTGLRLNIDVGHAISGVVAAGQRLRADLQPDGGCGHGGDFARAGLAVGPPSGEARRRQGDYPRTGRRRR